MTNINDADAVLPVFEYKAGYTFKAIITKTGLKIELTSEQQDDFGIVLPEDVVNDFINWLVRKRDELEEQRKLGYVK